MRFDSSALAENRAGRMTASQAEDVRAHYRGMVSRDVPVAAMMVLIVVLAEASPARRAASALEHWAIIAAGAAIAVIALLSLWRVIAFRKDIAEQRVVWIDGPARPRRVSTRTSALHFIVVNGTQLKVDRAAYDAISPLRTYRAYYLPRSKFVVNLEILT